MSHTPHGLRAKRNVRIVRLVVLCSLLLALGALPFIARTEAAPSADDSLRTHHSSRFSWLGGNPDIYSKILAGRSARTLRPAPLFLGQLLDWNTFGNVGTETTEPSVFNNTNISAANLTLGAGVTGSGNGNRFGGNAWFDGGDTNPTTLAESIAGHDYIEFIVTPNVGFSFTPTSFVFNWERSSTGPNNVTLRSSVDGFATDIGTVNFPGTTLTTGNTITISGLTNLTTATTFRLYGYGATAGTGAGGFDTTTNAVNVSLNGTTAALPATYTWAPLLPGTDDSYQNALNWNPDRLVPAVTDVLVVDGTSTPTTNIDNIPTQTIAQFRFINGAAVTLSSAAANTLTIAGAAGTDFDVTGSSQVKLSGTSQLTISLPTGATGNIDNLLSFESTGGSRLIAADAGAVTFPTATNCTALAGYVGNPFGTNAAGAGAGSIVFQSGAFYTHQSGDSPFGAASDSQIVNFASGSMARWFTTSGFQANGRIYANLEIGNGLTAVTVSDTGTGDFQFEDLTVRAAGATNSSLTYTGSGSAAVTIGGSISSTGIGTGSLPDITLIAPGGVTISRPASSITFGNDGSNARALNLDGNVALTNTTTLTLSRIVLLGLTNPNTKTFTVSSPAILNGGATGYIVGGLKKNFTGSDLSRTFEIGTTTAYTPVNLSFAAVSVSGDVTANTFSGDHADTTADTSGINKNLSVNEYWNLTRDGSIAFSTYDATFNFTAGLIDGGANPANFIVRKKDAGVWTSPSVGTKTATSTQATGMATMSDFAVGESLTPEIDVKGNGISIPDGDTTPDLADGTDFGSTPSSHTFTIENTGAANLTLSGTPFVQITGPNASDFTVTSQPSSPVTPSGSTTFTIFAGASAVGTRTATVSITNDDSDENPYTFDIQIVGVSTLTVTPATTPTATDNDYTRINNAVQAAFSGQTIKLLGTFNWTETNAAASWALGSDGQTGGSFSNDDYGITPKANVNNVTFTADNLGDGEIQGPGDLAGVNLEGVFAFFLGDNQNWTISNIRFLDFDLSIGFFQSPGGSDAYNNTQLSNNYIRMARDLNATVAPADVNQNIAIHLSFGANQVISGNTIEIQGDGISAGANFATDVALQSNTSGGAVYDGLQITNNIVRVLNAQDAANPQVVLGIWENAHAHSSDITLSGNQFINQAGGNNPATNLQRAFRVTSHSSATTTVTYSGNSISGANIGFQWLAGQNFSGNQPVIVEGNTITNNGTGLLVQSQGVANIRFNRIVGNTTGLNNVDGNVTAENNWWGCNAGPGNPGCDSVTGTADFDPWVVLLVSASPSSITPGGTSTITADMTRNSGIGNPAHGGAAILPLPDASFSATNGTMLPTTNSFSSGQTTSTFTSTNSSNGSACADVDNQQTCAPITVTAPSFTIDDVTMAEGNGGPGSTSFIFTITKTGATAFNASVDYETVPGTAVSPTDFTAIPVTNVTFLPSETTKQVTVFVNGELAVEPDETFTLQLSNASGATIGDASGLGTIQNDDACPPQATVYVDDSWTGTPLGTDPDGGGLATNFGCDSFATIQGGVDGVAVGGTVIVYAGTYNEDVNVYKAGVSILGAGAGSVSVVGPIGGSGATFQITASNVTLAGMTITRAGNNTTDWNNPNLNSVGVAIQGLSVTGALIRDNVITGNRTGIDINNSGGHTIRNNVIDFNRTGLIFRNQTDQMTVIENFITNNWTVGVLFLDASGGTNSPVQQALHGAFNNNSISANWYGQIVDRQSGGSLPPPATTNYKNFRGNWFGTTSPVVTTANSAEPGYAVQIPVLYGGSATPPGGQPDIAGPASANFQYTPFLLSGTDTDVETVPGRGTNGFQGVANTVVVSYVTPNGWFFFDDLPGTGTGSGGFEIGPATPPLGTGSAFLTVDAQGRHALGVFNYNGTRADDLLALLYHSYQNNNTNTVVANSLQFDIDYDLNDAATAYSGRLVFEPYLSPAQGAVAQNVWQNWDARGGMWYGTRTTVTVNNVAGVPQPCQPASPCTWAQVLSLFPNAGVRNAVGSAVLFKAGGPWAPGFDGNVDNFRLQHNGALVTYDFEPGPQLSINDVTQVETNGGTTAFTFNVTLTESSSQTITVNYQTADDSATTADLDYNAVASTGITFNPGETSKPVTIQVNGDTKFELNDQFFVNLSGPVNATILDGQGVGTITNDDTQPTILIDDVTAFEGDSGTTDFNFTVSLSNASYQTITVTAQTADGTALISNADYNGAGPTILTFAPNVTTQPFQVQANGDTNFEQTETFVVNLSLPTNATISDPQGTGTITNDDAAPSISINDLTATEGTTAVPPLTKQFNFTVTKTGTTTEQASVTFQTADDTGGVNPATSGADCSTPGVDYIPNSGTVIFPASGPGSTSQTVTILVCRDSVFEANETFLVTLSGPVDATISDGQAVGTITNDDVPSGGFVVNTTADGDDGSCLPIGSGNGCTLREAINAANASPAATAINFAIPANDARHFYYKDDGVANQVTHDLTHVLVTTAANDAALPVDKDPDWPHGWWSILPASALPALTQAATVDGYTQTEAAVNTSATSTNAVLRIEVEGSSAGATVTGLVVSNGSSIVRGLVINRFTDHGLQSSGAVTGNFIGTDVSGTLDLGNTGSGVLGANNMTIGGTTPQLANLLSGNDSHGILFTNFNSSIVHGNYVGTKADGVSALGNGGNGIHLTGGSAVFNTIGGTASGEPNIIAFNANDGVSLPDAGIGNVIRGNSIFSNGTTASHLGIDHGPVDGETANDAAPDADSGPNALQNFPVIRSAVVGSPHLISGTLSSVPNQTFTIDLYANTVCDTSGNGEGKTYLGSTTTTTDANGLGGWRFSPATLNLTDQITATATSVNNNTSEFSLCFTPTTFNAGQLQFAQTAISDPETNTGSHTVTFTVQRVGGSNRPASVNYTINDGSATVADNDYSVSSPTGTLQWPNGDSTDRTITITVNGDTKYEGDETLTIVLSSPVGATIAGPDTATLTITDDDLLLVDDDLVQCPTAAYTTIQSAITAALAGQTVQVCAGTYEEHVTVNKSLTVLGPNANINPNTGVRVAEAIISPIASDPLNPGFNGPIVVTFSASGVTFKGFTVDGDNPLNASGVVFNGSDVDAEFGIYGDGSADMDAVIENNIVQNIGEIAIWLNTFGIGGPRNANSRITANKVDNVLGAFGQALRISDDCWADVTNNVVTRSRLGIVIENFSGNVTTHPASVIENNDVTTFRIGIRHNLHYVYGLPGFTIRNNTVQSYVQTPMPSQVTTPTTYEGIRVESIQQTVTVDVTNNTVDGNRTALQTAGYTRVEGLGITNSSAVSPNIRFTGNRSTDSIRGVFHDTPAVPTFTCNTIAGNSTGVEISANATNGLIANNNNIFGNGVGMLNNSPAGSINAENNYWGSATGPTIASNPTGTGDSITGTGALAVDYDPFLTSAASCAPVAPPTISKAFGTVSVPPNGSTTLSFTIGNPNSSTLTGIGFTDPLPAGLIVATPNGLTGSCGGGTITAADGSSSISLSGATLTGGATCTFTVNVEVNTLGAKNNTTGNVSSTEGGVGGTASATLNVTPPSLSISDVTLAEGTGGTTNFVFTVTKTGDGATDVNFTTVDGTAQDDLPVSEDNDYTPNNGTLSFGVTEPTKTITVVVNGDATPELIENFTVVLSGQTGGATITDDTGLGTILNDDESATAGQLIISEFRLSGPGANATEQANNEFIELYNSTDQDLFVTTTDGSTGWAVANSSGVPIFFVPNGTTIPARGHFLGTNTNGYSLKDYGGTDAALGDATWTTDVPDNTALAVFRTNNAANFNATNRLDSVGPNTETNPLYKEAAGYAPLAPADVAQNLEHTFFRQICVFQAGCPTPGRPRDTQDNAADFIFGDTTGAPTSAGQRLGSPGPENLASPIKRDPVVNLVLLDATVSEAVAPNRDRNTTSDPVNASLFGTMTIRRRVVNQTGGTVTRLRFRVIDMTTQPSGAFADLRLRSSSNQVISMVNDANTCASTGTPTTAPCSVNVTGLTLEQPPNHPAANGGGLNTTVTLPLSGGLPDGQSINVNFLLGIQKTGAFRFYLVIEALP
ncbi:MAG TPA: Calx-beta domain-containing protein [Pyrinomonadaceae bacterium]|nr:Calx-beta domain-containing protein [Pyrinomonadaceae bacterium]